MVRKGVCVVLLYGRSLVGVYDNNIYMSDKVVCLVDKGGTFSGLVVSSQGAWKCVLILLAVLHQPVYKSVCKCVWRWTVENGLRAMDRLPLSLNWCAFVVSLFRCSCNSSAWRTQGKVIEAYIVGSYCVC